MIVASKQIRCRIDVRLTNSGSRSVEVEEAIGTFAEPQTGTIFACVDENAPSPASEVDAFVPVGKSVPPRGALTVLVVLEYHQEGCNAAGRFWVSGWPAFTVSALGRSQTGAAQRSAATPSSTSPGEVQPLQSPLGVRCAHHRRATVKI